VEQEAAGADDEDEGDQEKFDKAASGLFSSDALAALRGVGVRAGSSCARIAVGDHKV